MASLDDLSKMTVPGTTLQLIQGSSGWIANYEIRIKGKKRRKNIGASADTPKEAVQDANNELAHYLATYKPELWV